MTRLCLEDVCTAGSSNIAQKDLDRHNGAYPIYGAGGFIKNVDFYKQKKSYIAIVKDGAGVGRIMKLPAESSIIGTMQYIIPKENINIEYLAFALEHMNLGKYCTGATIPHIYFKDYCKEKLPLHDLEEQRKIADILSKTTNTILLRKQQLSKLDELVKSQFIEMFCSSIVGAENWPLVKIEEISKKLRTGPFGSALLHSEFVDSGVFVLGIDNAVENHFSYNRMRYIKEEKYEKLKQYTVNSGDVIVTIMGTVGRSAVIPDGFPKAINTKHLACLTLNKNVADSHFISYAFQEHPVLLEQLHSQSKGAIMAGLNLKIIKNLQFQLPPLSMQQIFVEFINQTDRSKSAIQNSLEKFEILKEVLMQQYFG